MGWTGWDGLLQVLRMVMLLFCHCGDCVRICGGVMWGLDNMLMIVNPVTYALYTLTFQYRTVHNSTEEYSAEQCSTEQFMKLHNIALHSIPLKYFGLQLYFIALHRYTHTSIHSSIHASIHPSMHPYMHTCIHAYLHTCINAYMHTAHAYILTYLIIPTCMRAFAYTVV